MLFPVCRGPVTAKRFHRPVLWASVKASRYNPAKRLVLAAEAAVGIRPGGEYKLIFRKLRDGAQLGARYRCTVERYSSRHTPYLSFSDCAAALLSSACSESTTRSESIKASSMILAACGPNCRCRVSTAERMTWANRCMVGSICRRSINTRLRSKTSRRASSARCSRYFSSAGLLGPVNSGSLPALRSFRHFLDAVYVVSFCGFAGRSMSNPRCKGSRVYANHVGGLVDRSDESGFLDVSVGKQPPLHLVGVELPAASYSRVWKAGGKPLLQLGGVDR